MAKGTIILIFVLSILAVFLLGIKVGQNIGNPKSQETANIQPSINAVAILSPLPSLSLTPFLPSTPSATPLIKITNVTTYTDKKCGFSFSYPSSFIREKSTNEGAVIYLNPDNPNDTIIATCLPQIPRPPLSADKIESIILDGQPATLYHDQSQKDGSPRDEIIVKHPKTEMEIIVAGFGAVFEKAISTFKFIR